MAAAVATASGVARMVGPAAVMMAAALRRRMAAVVVMAVAVRSATGSATLPLCSIGSAPCRSEADRRAGRARSDARDRMDRMGLDRGGRGVASLGGAWAMLGGLVLALRRVARDAAPQARVRSRRRPVAERAARLRHPPARRDPAVPSARRRRRGSSRRHVRRVRRATSRRHDPPRRSAPARSAARARRSGRRCRRAAARVRRDDEDRREATSATIAVRATVAPCAVVARSCSVCSARAIGGSSRRARAPPPGSARTARRRVPERVQVRQHPQPTTRVGQLLGGTAHPIDSAMRPAAGIAYPCNYQVSSDGSMEYWTFDFDCRDGMKQRADALFAQYPRSARPTWSSSTTRLVRCGALKPTDAGIAIHAPAPRDRGRRRCQGTRPPRPGPDLHRRRCTVLRARRRARRAAPARARARDREEPDVRERADDAATVPVT